MQWDASRNAGFSTPDVEELWLPLARDYKEFNVASQLSDPYSMLNFSGQEQNLSLPEISKGRVVFSTNLDLEDEVNLADFNLRANEGCIIEL